jgi:hypothetical protein
VVTVWKLNSRTLTSATIEGNEWLHPATRATESSISLIGCLQGSINTAHSKTSSHQAQHSTSAWVFHLLGNLSSKKNWHFSRLHWILWRNCGKSQNSMLHHATHVTHIVRQHNLTKWNAIQLPCHDTLFRGAFSCYVHERPSNLESLEHTFPRTRPINERTGKSLQQSEFETVWIQKANKVTSYGI